MVYGCRAARRDAMHADGDTMVPRVSGLLPPRRRVNAAAALRLQCRVRTVGLSACVGSPLRQCLEEPVRDGGRTPPPTKDGRARDCTPRHTTSHTRVRLQSRRSHLTRTMRNYLHTANTTPPWLLYTSLQHTRRSLLRGARKRVKVRGARIGGPHICMIAVTFDLP